MFDVLALEHAQFDLKYTIHILYKKLETRFSHYISYSLLCDVLSFQKKRLIMNQPYIFVIWYLSIPLHACFTCFIDLEPNAIVYIIVVPTTRLRRRSLQCTLCSKLFRSETLLGWIFYVCYKYITVTLKNFNLFSSCRASDKFTMKSC